MMARWRKKKSTENVILLILVWTIFQFVKIFRIFIYFILFLTTVIFFLKQNKKAKNYLFSLVLKILFINCWCRETARGRGLPHLRV